MTSGAGQTDWRPSHAYVPGQTDRHPEDLFDFIKASITKDLPTNGLFNTAAGQYGLTFLREGFFWEAHEVLEPIWMACPDPSAERKMVQALIQLANAKLKSRMKRPRAVSRLLDIADQCFKDAVALQLDHNPVPGQKAYLETRKTIEPLN